MRLGILMLMFLSGCDLIPTSPDPGATQLNPDQIVFEFSYENSSSFNGWIKFQNHCKGINGYTWYLGISDADGKEIISYNPAPKIQYPSNGMYQVRVNGVAYDSTRHERKFTVHVNTY